MYLALTGRLPFHADSPFSIMLKHKTEEPPSLRSLRSDLHEEMDHLVLTMLAKRPEDRYASLRDLIHAVEHAARVIAGTDSVLRGERGGTPSSTRMPVVEGEHDSSDEWLPTPASVAMLEQGAGRRVDSSTTYQPATDHRRNRTDAEPQPDYGSAHQPVSTDIRLAAAQGAIERGEFADAVRGFEDVLKDHPEDGEVREQLEGALERKRSDEFHQFEEEAKDLSKRKRWKTAARSWQQAAALAANERDRRRCERRASEAGRFARRRRFRRLIAGFIVLIVMAFAGAWQGTPLAHNLLASHRFDRILTIDDNESRRAELAAFVERYDTIPQWYDRLFGALQLPHDYSVDAVSEAKAILDSMSRAASDEKGVQPDETEADAPGGEAIDPMDDKDFVP